MIPPRHKPLIVRDEIHGDMPFDGLLHAVIDHEIFQRLRYIKQLGLAEYVFPCATHTRFQHSLGASYLAGQNYRSVLDAWLTSPFQYEGLLGSTRFFARRTFESIQSVVGNKPSDEFWFHVVSLAGMLHDVGHGPWSHSFEQLDLPLDFSAIISRMTGGIAEHFKRLAGASQNLQHEDVSVCYIFQILTDLHSAGLIDEVEKYFVPVSLLVNKSILAADLSETLENEIRLICERHGIKGSVDFHRLLRPIISGPFDIDRMDYIQRDAKNCGVYIGGIEWRRIMNKVIPCLAERVNGTEKKSEVVLISNIKNQHVLDDFVFSLFQMYAQVYMHPKIVGMEDSIRRALERQKGGESKPVLDYQTHAALTDDGFRRMLRSDFGIEEISSILLRKPGYRFRVASYPADSGMEDELQRNRFILINTQDRPMMKDRLGLFLYSSFAESPQTVTSRNYLLKEWEKVSPIAEQFNSIRYSPRIWIRPEPA